MRFFLLVYQYCADEVSELTDTFLAEDGIGFAAELGGVPIDHLLVPRMVRVFRDTRCLLANDFPAFILSLFGRRSGITLIIAILQFIHFLWTASENPAVRVMPFFLSHHQTRVF